MKIWLYAYRAIGAANGNERSDARLYLCLPEHRIFVNLHRRLREHGSFNENKRGFGRANYLIGLYLMPFPLSWEIYEMFQREVVPEMLEDEPLGIRRRIWLRNDGPPAHLHRNACQYLNNAFPNRWIGTNGPVAWPPISPDMTPLDFFLWIYMKSLIYETPVKPEMVLVTKIVVAAGKIAENSRVF